MLPRVLDALASSLEGPLASPRRLALLLRDGDGWLRSGRLAGIVRDVQRERLARALRRAASCSPYYRETLGWRVAEVDAVTAPAMLEQLPFTQPTELADWRRFLCVPEDRLAAIYTTSGTSGEPKVCGFTGREQRRLVNLWALGVRLGQPGPMRVLIALPTGHGLWIGTASTTRAVERAGGTPLPIGTPHPSEALAWMRRFEPNMVVSSPSYLAALTRQAEDEGYRVPVDSLTLGGEPLGGERRRYFSEYWDATVQESYGATEIGGPQTIALPGCRGLHLNELHLVTEIVEKDGDAPAEQGELVFTPLEREAMPLVRYRIGDRARWVECDCGLPLRCITLEGREDDMFTLGGTHLYGQVLADAITQLPGTIGRIALEVDRHDHIDRLQLRVGGESVDEDAVRGALWDAYPRLREVVDGGQLVLDIETGADLTRQIKSFSLRDRRRG